MSERTCSTPGCTGAAKARGLCNRHYRRWRLDNPDRIGDRYHQGDCSEDECAEPARTRGRCRNHYAQWLAARRQCSIEDCDRNVFARGWCSAHYMRWKRTGTPHRPTTEQRFFESVQAGPGNCWEWTGTREERGYGNFYFEDRTIKAHRWSFEFFVCSIPEGLELDHLCLNKWCVNPWHLEVVRGIENQRRRYGVFGSDLRLCMHGHAMTPDNVYINPRGVRHCRTCMRESLHRSRQRREVNQRKD